jgi:hypothetical protein
MTRSSQAIDAHVQSKQREDSNDEDGSAEVLDRAG